MTSTRSPDRPLRVLVLKSNDFPIGGAVRCVEMCVAHLDRQRVEPILGHVVTDDRPPTLLETSPRCTDIEHRKIMWPGVRRARSAAAELNKLVEETGADVVTSNEPRTNLLCRMAGGHRGLGIPWSALVHGWTGWKRKWGTKRFGIYETVDRWSIRGATEVWTPSHAGSRIVRRSLPSRIPIRVLPNAAEPHHLQTTPEKVSELRESMELPPDTLLVGTLGRMVWAKGHVLLAKAIVQSGCDNLVAVMLGFGEEEDNLRKMSQQPPYRGRMILPGEDASMNEVPTYLAALDIFCFPSLQESMPLALLEGMYLDNAVAASATGDIPVVLGDDEYGLLFPPGDVDAMAGCLRRLATDDSLRDKMRERARGRILSDYCAPRYAKDVENAWISLAERRRRRRVEPGGAGP